MADFKIKYGAIQALTFTSLDGLMGSSALVAGASSAYVDNTATLYLDALVSGQFYWSGTTPASGSRVLEVHAFSALDDTPTFPDAGGALGANAARTFASSNVKYGTCRLAQVINIDDVASRIYYLAPFSLRRLFGVMPSFWGIFVTHGVTTGLSGLSSSTGLSYVKWKPVLGQSAA